MWQTNDELGETKITGEVGDDRFVLLIVANGVREFDLAKSGDFTIGRAPTVEIHIQAASVSREHAIITVAGRTVTMRDLGSTNGTKVNGEPVGKQPVTVNVGDAIRLGDVIAQLRGGRVSPIYPSQFVAPAELDSRITDEAERCIRYDHSMAAITIEVTDRQPRLAEIVEQVVGANLRGLDAASMRAPGRVDMLLVESDKDTALATAERVRASLSKRGLPVKVGVSVYPGEVPSPLSLLLSAQLAMHGAEDGKVGLAREGARMVQLGEREIVVAEPAVARLFALIERVASAPIPVLIHGETGSGKEIVAEAIHALGNRATAPLIKINCAAMPENLLESELFGHVKGAFSGADSAKSGLFEEAHCGTLFLDEIGEMSPSLQAKLLRVLEDHRVRRVGATKDRKVDVRVVAATHRDLKKEAAAGAFRQDLFYRLSAMVLKVPPLRERPREIVLLAERFLAEACDQNRTAPPTISPEVTDALDRYDWPGNIRELRNVIGGAVMQCDGDELQLSHLPDEFAEIADEDDDDELPITPDRRLPLDERLRAIERDEIALALDESAGNQTRAAELLGMPRRTLVYKLKSFGIEAPTPRRKRKR